MLSDEIELTDSSEGQQSSSPPGGGLPCEERGDNALSGVYPQAVFSRQHKHEIL